MNKLIFPLVLGAGLYLTAGCNKKPVAQAPETPQPDTSVATTTTTAPAVAKTAVSPAEINGKVSEAQAAMRVKDYSKAADALSIAPAAITSMNAEQLAAYNKAKESLAQQVITGAASGDPSAKAAMDKMRQAALYHH